MPAGSDLLSRRETGQMCEKWSIYLFCRRVKYWPRRSLSQFGKTMYRHFALPCVMLLILLVCRHESFGKDQSASETGDASTESDDEHESAAPELIFQRTVEAGYVFVDSEYLSSPYLVEATASAVTVNGRVVRLRSDFNLDDDESDPADNEADGDYGSRRRRSLHGQFGRFPGWEQAARRRAAAKLVDDLDQDFVIVTFSDRPPKHFTDISDEYRLFCALLHPEPGSEAIRMFLLDECGSVEQQRFWTGWIGGFTMTDDLRTRVEGFVQLVSESEAKNLSEIRATHRLDAMAYPLTVLGMVLGILALGHLLKSFSKLEGSTEETLPSTEVLRATGVSIGLMVALSLFDLTWTVLASQAGQMKELNPLGSHLVSDPMMLIAFKLAATILGCGVLFALRRHQRARQACWWLCLICTVLTFRWVMFNSMFVA
jgi:Domain of unknown function (DUF5658)